jgi:hypothetical protein
MRTILLLSVGLLLFSGCCQVGEGLFEELGTCMEKCDEVCDAVEASDIDLEGYQIGLTKEGTGQVGGATTTSSVSCQCLCG